MWSKLAKQGKIVMGKHTGYYCTNEESFIPEKELTIREGRRFTALGHEAEYVEEENFQLLFDEECQQFVKKWLKNQKAIIPSSLVGDLEQRTNKVGSKLSVSRPSSRVDWGIRVPGYPDHTIYVWFDALFNYLTVSRGLEANEPLRMIHLIGKDIATFHCVYWPGYLHSLGLSPPESVVIHGHWLKDGKKMSKSLGNVVDPFTIVKKHGADAFKFYFLTHGPLRSDANFDENEMADLYNDFVVGAYINILFRIMGKKPTTFDLEGASLTPEQKQLASNVESVVRETRDIVNKDFDFVNGYVALRRGADLINKYINHTEFWKEKDQQKLKILKFAVIRSFLQLSVGVQLFVPQLANKVLEHFAVDINHREGEDVIERQLMEIKSKSQIQVNPKAIKAECYVQRLVLDNE